MIFNWFIAEHFPTDKFPLHFDPIKRNMSVAIIIMIIIMRVSWRQRVASAALCIQS